MPYIHPSEEAITQVMTDAQNLDEPIRMINLLKFREVAEYSKDDPPSATADGPVSGADAYSTYASVAFPEVQTVGGSQFYTAATQQTVIGPDDEDWEKLVTVSAHMTTGGRRVFRHCFPPTQVS